MTNEELNTAVYQKMTAEQEKYKGWLLQQPPEEILMHTYEYTVRQDILMAMEDNILTDDEAAALLKMPDALQAVFEDISNLDTDYMMTVRDCVVERADTEIQLIKDAAQKLRDVPVYQYPMAYARENGELELCRDSHQANVACRDAIDKAIVENYRDNCLGRAAVGQVVEQFGYDRTLYVLANTVKHKDWDGRFSRVNKEWADTQPIFEDKDAWGGDRNTEFVVDRSHPGLVDLFTTQAKHDYLLTQPLSNEDIHKEAARVLQHLQEPQKPNSPNGTHYMVQISPDFLARASGKDQDKLFAMLPFSTLNFTALTNRKGLYATISQEEDRSKNLRERKPSVRKMLGDNTAQPKPPKLKSPRKNEPEL